MYCITDYFLRQFFFFKVSLYQSLYLQQTVDVSGIHQVAYLFHLMSVALNWKLLAVPGHSVPVTDFVSPVGSLVENQQTADL